MLLQGYNHAEGVLLRELGLMDELHTSQVRPAVASAANYIELDTASLVHLFLDSQGWYLQVLPLLTEVLASNSASAPLARNLASFLRHQAGCFRLSMKVNSR